MRLPETHTKLRPLLLVLVTIPVHFLCFYWWTAQDYYFAGDDLFYFSRQIDSLQELAARFLSVDEMYQYRPLTYVVFTFFLFPLFGTNPQGYHLIAYLFTGLNALLACACMYYWSGRKAQIAWFAGAALVLSPVQFFPSFGPTYTDQWLSSFFYFLTLLFMLRESRYSHIAPVLFVFALLAKEHSVMVPAHALLVMLALDVPFRDAVKKTRHLWMVLGVFLVFQLVIRQGDVFAPSGSNPNLQFGFSATRILELAKGAKAAIFYPENYLLDGESGFGRWIRLSSLVPILGVVVFAIKRRPRLATSALLWVGLSLLPVAFLRQAPFPRHYCIGLLGFAMLFACAVPSWRSVMLALPIMAVVTITNVQLYARESWVAAGARSTRSYLGQIQAAMDSTQQSSFYVTSAGDSNFFWHIDGGASIPHVLGRQATFRFAALKEPLPVDEWLSNGVNVIEARDGEIAEAVRSGRFPPPASVDSCRIVSGITGVDGACSIIFRGHPLLDESVRVVETPTQLPIFEVPEGIVTLSRSTIRVPATAGMQLKRTVRVVPESADGVRIELYGENEDGFTRLYWQTALPGESREVDCVVPAGRFHHVLIRVHPGPLGNEQGDWLVWRRLD